MPWEITIIGGTPEARKPLGTIEEVNAIFADVLDGVTLEQPPLPPAAFLAQMSEFLRAEMLRPRREADFEQDELSIQFATGDESELNFINAEVRGMGNPLPILAALCRPRSWSVIDSASKTTLNLNDPQSHEWQAFQEYRDSAVAEDEDEEEE
jgi:hypothetical protein